MTDTVVAVEQVVELENHIFIHPPDKTGEDTAQCYECGKPAERHKWKSPRPWAINEKHITAKKTESC